MRQFNKESEAVKGHVMLDHVKMLIYIPRKFAVAQVVDFIKGESPIHLGRTFGRYRIS